MKEISFSVSPEQGKTRLDILLSDYSLEKGLGLSRTAIQKLIAEGRVLLNSSVADRPHRKVIPGEAVSFSFPEKKKEEVLPEEIPLEVVYEDDDLAVINKPAGLVVHPAPGNREHTLVNALLGRFKDLSDINKGRPGIVHRLDKETSGLLVVAKNNPSHLKLARQFSEHSIERKYVALVSGEVKFDEDTIEAPIGRHPFKRKNMSVSFSKGTRNAKTFYRTLKRGNNFSFVELRPFTGRTHQLRVHLAFLGYPILGDSKYGRGDTFPRMALHAQEIGFIHPSTGKSMFFSSKLPPEFEEFIGKNF